MSQSVLPKELIELQLAQVDLLQAMYPGEGAIVVDETSSASLDTWRAFHGGEIDSVPPNTAYNSALFLTLEVDNEEGVPKNTFQVEVIVPFTFHDDGMGYPDEPPPPRLRLLQPSWMSKAEAAKLMADIPREEDLFTKIEHIKGAACSHLLSSTSKCDPPLMNTTEEAQPFVRVWFYFPSISTRAKRDDIVNYAPSYRLTGFLLSGKPGVLCLEGPSDRVDEYMKFIKTESWSDIPAHQKKVSERFREMDITRVFGDMQEITDALGERRGERANRGDMKALEAWLVERGLGAAFMKVLA